MNITVLGSTGSIGVSTLDVVRQNQDRFKIHALVAGKNLAVLCSQILEFRPNVVVVADDPTLDELRLRLQDLTIPMKGWPDLAAGPEARLKASVAPEVDFVMSAIVGVAGLRQIRPVEGVVGGGVKVVEKRRFENPAGVSLERSNFAMLI